MAETTVGREKLMKKLRAEQKKNADARARTGKPGSGTITERVKKAAKKAPEKRGVPAKIEKPRGNANKANPPKEIRLKGEGGTGRALKDTKFKPIPLGDRPKALPAPKAAPRTFNPAGAAGRLLGPAGFLVGMTTPTGDGQEDKPSGPLMRGGRQPGYKYRGTQTVNRSEKKDLPERIVGMRGGQGVVPYNTSKDSKFGGTLPKSTPPKPKLRPERKAERKAEPRKVERKAERKTKPSAQRVAFKGNWVGAAPTQMQKRGGARIKRNGGVLGALKRKGFFS